MVIAGGGAAGAPPSRNDSSARSPVMGIVSLVLSVVGGAGLLWASAEGSAGDLISLVGVNYNIVRALFVLILVLGIVLGIVAMRTRRGRWWGLVSVILGGGALLLVIVFVVLLMLLFAVVGGALGP